MLDIRKLESEFESVKANLSNRNFDTSVLNEILELNKQRKNLTTLSETKKADINKLSREIGELKKNKLDAAGPMGKVADLKSEMDIEARELDEVLAKQNSLLLGIPNLLDASTPVGKTEDDNVEVKRWGTTRKFDFTPIDHADLGEKLGMLDFESAAKITGARFVVYKSGIARLERALINFMLDHQGSKGFTEMMTPFIAHERSLVGTGNLPKFRDQLFKLEDTDWYLIPTSEVTLTNLKREQISEESEFPCLYAAYSPCFRSEAGSHGKDVKGLIRMHQFNKVEMVAICSPAQSPAIHQKMVDSACEILEKLGLPYRAIALCTGDIGFASQKTFDLEVWVPSQNKYREISSISNCGDFQARRANIRFRNKEGKVEFAHTLNGSGLAVGRTVVAILENYQEADGSVKIPEVLWPYMGGLKEIRK
ncbi:MAG TPA: serine--tRNA ligase [Bacteriovoracaceae bacterium]|nr:serine--tRNA ligase [Bacteriovoracaceae bacterium]